MKQDAWRRQLPSYPFSGEVLPRYTDVDLWQHLNNVSLISLQIESVQRLLLDVLGDAAWRAGATGTALGPQASSTDFLAEAYYPAPLTAAARITQVDAQHIAIVSALFQNGQCVGLHQSRVVAWADGEPAPLPPEVCAAMVARMAAQPPLPGAPAPAGGPEATIGAAPADAMQALPLRPADFPVPFELVSRFGDHDAASRFSDQALGRMAEQGRVNMLTALMGPERLSAPVGFMVAHVSLHWLHRGRAPQVWQVGGGVLRSGERAITIRAQLHDGEACHALCDSVMVAIDRDARGSVRLPVDLRGRVEAQLIR